MNENIVLLALALFPCLPSISSLYFHETSRIFIKPSKANPLSEFGFAMTFQNSTPANLVIGAPRDDLMGKVYQCSIDDLQNSETLCDMVNLDVESAATYRRDVNPNQYFHLGASIVATSDYFFTCAPLWTDNILKRSTPVETYACGKCFSYNGNTTAYVGSLDQYKKSSIFNGATDLVKGGVGWTNLIDEGNNMLLIAKSFVHGDITYVKSSAPTSWTSSLMKKYLKKKIFAQQTNLGYGLAAGNFFDNSTVYAFSMQPHQMRGMVAFLELKNPKLLDLVKDSSNKLYMITSGDVASMFGATLHAADLNRDCLSELLVGAPGLSNDERFEYGAIHIYIGGDKKTFNGVSNVRSIIGVKEGARFGTTIASCDIDGDGLPEIFVSAPYEDSGLGAVYILSGHELVNKLLKINSNKHVELSALKFTQRLQDKNHKTFGYSLQVIPDTDNNGCDELAVGSPGSATVVLFRCLPAVNLNLTTQLSGGRQNVREQDNFAVTVCVQISYNTKLENITTKLMVTSSVKGSGASISSPKFLVDLSKRQLEYCSNVSVEINNYDPGFYEFKAQIELDLDYNNTLQSKEFSNTWAVLRPYDKTEQTLEISRHCEGDDCSSKLNASITWSGSQEYVLGSTMMENVTITVRNDGHNAYQACVTVRVSGAKVSRMACASLHGEYTCWLPKPLMRNKEHSINLMLDMTNPPSTVKMFDVKVKLYENCNQPNFTVYNINIPYRLSTHNIFVEGLNNYRNITDQEIIESDIATINDGHEFLIINNGSVTWINVRAVITVEKKSFIVSYKGPSNETHGCDEQDSDDTISFICTFTLTPKTTKKIFASMEIAKKDLRKNLINGKLITMTNLKLHLPPTSDVISKGAQTEITFQKELSVKNDKNLIILIAIIVAMIIMAGVIFMLYKFKFFKRKQKQRLEVLRESVRRKSIKRSTADTDDKQKTTDDKEDTSSMEMEVVEDCPFSDIPITINDGVVLIEERAQVHC